MLYTAQINFHTLEIRARNHESALRKALKFTDKFTKSVKIVQNGRTIAAEYLRPKTGNQKPETGGLALASGKYERTSAGFRA